DLTPTSLNNAPSARAQHTAVWDADDGLMIVWGGTEYSGYPNTGGRYDPVTNLWTPTSTTNAPSGQNLHTAVWTGSRMIVWGGGLYRGVNTGGRYDPTADA